MIQMAFFVQLFTWGSTSEMFRKARGPSPVFDVFSQGLDVYLTSIVFVYFVSIGFSIYTGIVYFICSSRNSQIDSKTH